MRNNIYFLKITQLFNIIVCYTYIIRMLYVSEFFYIKIYLMHGNITKHFRYVWNVYLRKNTRLLTLYFLFHISLRKVKINFIFLQTQLKKTLKIKTRNPEEVI